MTKSAGQVTASTSAPTVRLLDVSGVGETTATFSASFSSDTTVTAQKFEYDTNYDFSTKTTVNISPIETSPFDADVTGLTAGQTYYHRAIVTNGDGTTTTPSESFNTVATSEATGATGSATGPGTDAPETPSGYTLVYTADWSSSTDGWSSSASVAQVTGDVDTVSDDNSLVLNNVLEASRTASHTIAAFWVGKNMAVTLGSNLQSNGKTYIVVADVLVPSSNDVISIGAIRFGGLQDTEVQNLTQGEWYRATTSPSSFTISSTLYVYGTTPGSDTDDKYYVGNLWLYESN